MDIQMPGMSGVAALAEFKQNDALRNIRLILVSSWRNISWDLMVPESRGQLRFGQSHLVQLSSWQRATAASTAREKK